MPRGFETTKILFTPELFAYISKVRVIAVFVPSRGEPAQAAIKKKPLEYLAGFLG